MGNIQRSPGLKLALSSKEKEIIKVKRANPQNPVAF